MLPLLLFGGHNVGARRGRLQVVNFAKRAAMASGIEDDVGVGCSVNRFEDVDRRVKHVERPNWQKTFDLMTVHVDSVFQARQLVHVPQRAVLERRE